MIREVKLYQAACDKCSRRWQNRETGQENEVACHDLIDMLCDDKWRIEDGTGLITCPDCLRKPTLAVA